MKPRARTQIACATGVAVAVALAIAHVHRASQLGADPLAGAAPLIDALLAAFGAVYAAAARVTAGLRLPLAAILLVGLGAALATGRALPGWTRLAVALALGWMAQSFLSEGRWAAGVGLYAAAGVGYLARAGAPAPLPRAMPPRREVAAYVLLLGLFVGLCLHRLDVYPPLYYDEGAYLIAARMESGDLEPGPISVTEAIVAPRYGFDRFRAQIVPLWVHAAAVRWISASVLSLRLVSVAAGVATLLVAAAAIRRRLGPQVALWMLALSSVSPLFLAYSRTAFYLSFSPLHAALCFVAVFRLAERWDRSSAALAGLLLGSSAYFYQASWFVPLVAATALLAARGPRRCLTPPSVPILAVALALASLLPAVSVLRSGFGEVFQQTFDERAAWGPVGHASAELSRPRGASDGTPVPWTGAFTTSFWFRSGRQVIRISAPPRQLEEMLLVLEQQGWELESRGPALPRSLRNLADMASILFFAPGYDQVGRWVREPLLTHLLAPLAVLGVLEALRRRREPVLRMLLVMAILTALLPGTLGLAAPKRAVLLMPFLHALSALPILEASRRSRGSRTSAAAGILLFAAALCAGGHAYFDRWYEPAGREQRAPRPDVLAYRKLLVSLPGDRPILLSKPLGRLERMRHRLEGEVAGERRPTFLTGPLTPRRAWSVSCATPPPFVWISETSREDLELLERVARDFGARDEARDGLRVLHLESRPRSCDRLEPASGDGDGAERREAR